MQESKRQFPDRHGGSGSAPSEPGHAAAPASGGTAMRVRDTASLLEWSRAAAKPIGKSLGLDGVDSMTQPSTRPTTPGARTSATATRTSTTRTTSTACSRSADSDLALNAAPSFAELVIAFRDCIRGKRGTESVMGFELDRTRNLWRLYQDLLDGSWRPGTSMRCIVTHPKVRDIWAAQVRDRIVHWLWHNRWAPTFMAGFIADTSACIPGRGTHYAVRRLENHVRSASQNWTRPIFYAKFDLWNFFNTIDKSILFAELAKKVPLGWWLDLTHTIIFHDCTKDFEVHGHAHLVDLVPPHKRLTEQQEGVGLPIGNLPSQHAANVVLNRLDQFIKHRLRAQYYGRYVDDGYLLHESPQQLNEWLREIEAFLTGELHMKLNPSKTVIQPVNRGVDFVGYCVLPYRTLLRRRTIHQAKARIATAPQEKVAAVANSYFGLARQATKSLHDRLEIAEAVFARGKAVNGNFTKTYTSNEARHVV